MAIADDISCDINGNFRWTGDEATTYSVLEFHRDYIAPLIDDAQASGDDLLDITTDTPSDKKTDQILDLLGTFNIDDTLARHLYGGSVSQDNGRTLYSGGQWVGTVAAGTEIMIVQDGKVLPPYWGTGINTDAANNVIMELLIKTREGGADINGKRIRSFVKEWGDTWKEFQTTMGTGVSVAALDSSTDLNNATAIGTVRGWTTVVFTESSGTDPVLRDIDGDGTDEEYYISADKGSQTLNDTYEVAKLRAVRAQTIASGTDTGTWYTIDNGTIVGQSQSFTSNAVAEKLREARFRIRIGAGTPTGPLHAELYASTGSPVIPTGAVLATSEPVLASRILSPTTSSEVIFRFEDNVTLSASTVYTIVIRHPDGTAGNYFEVEGSGAGGGTAAGNMATENPASTWTGDTDDDLWFTVKGSEILYGRAGELHRGVTHEVLYDTEAGGPFTVGETVFWGTQITYDNLTNGPFTVGNYVRFTRSGTLVNGGKILKDTGSVLTVALDNTTGNLLDNDDITEIEDGTATTAIINVTITDQNRAGGEATLLSLDDNGATGELYFQLFYGTAPVDNLQIEGRTSGATCLVATTVTAFGLPATAVWLGQSTGSNLIGARGFGFDPADVGASDIFFDLGNTQRVPPNNVTNTVTGLVSGEDRVLVGPRTGSSLNKTQFTTDTALTAVAETVVSLATVAVPTDTPSTGQATDPTRLRVERDSGIITRQPYSSYDAATPGNFTLSLPDSGAGGVQIDVVATAGTFTRASGSFITDGFEPFCTFTGSGFANGGNNAQFTVLSVSSDGLTITVTDNTGMVNETGSGDERLLADGWAYNVDQAASGNNVWIAYLDKLAAATSESYTAVYTSDRDTLTRVRDGGGTPIKTFEANTVFGSSNSSVAAIRQSDA